MGNSHHCFTPFHTVELNLCHLHRCLRRASSIWSSSHYTLLFTLCVRPHSAMAIAAAAKTRAAALQQLTIAPALFSYPQLRTLCALSHPTPLTAPLIATSALGDPEAPLKKRKRNRKPPAFPDPYKKPPPATEFPAYEPRDFFRFELIHQSSKSNARVGRIYTPHGIVDTPGFVAVGTNGALKALDHRIVEEQCQLMFCNTYHLLLHPGPKVIREAGGLHKFMNRKAPIITDSGGFQVFSLDHGSVHDELNMKRRQSSKSKNNNPETTLLMAVTEEGALFRSYRDGTRVLLTPESSVQAQKAYSSDIIIPLDELPPYHIDSDRLKRSVLLSHRWEARSLQTHLDNVQDQAMYAVIHGGIDEQLRKMSIDYLTSLPFDGFGIGGSLGKNRQELFDLLAFVMPRLPSSRPNHLLGIADIESISGAVPLGVDTFDSCFPTRLGRHGSMLTHRFGRVNIRAGKWKSLFEPPDWEGGLQGHSLAYLHHLFKMHEPMAATLLTLHNILFMHEYMAGLRAKILNDEI
jgi:queuine tRNA-ribosyltransferase